MTNTVRRRRTWPALVLAIASWPTLVGCGVSISTTPSFTPPPSSQSGASRATGAQSGATGAKVVISGTLGFHRRATFAAWVGGHNASGQYVWIPVTVVFAPGFPTTLVDGQLLQQYGFQSDGRTRAVVGLVTSGPVTGYQYVGLTLVPAQHPEQAIAVSSSWYSGIGVAGYAGTFQVSIGEDLLHQGHLAVHGNTWTFSYVPAEVLTSPPHASNSG